jgi:hypothetical protein
MVWCHIAMGAAAATAPEDVELLACPLWPAFVILKTSTRISMQTVHQLDLITLVL